MIIQGIVPPLVTPLRSADTLDIAGLERLVANQLTAGVDGLFILGTTGEGPSLSSELQRQVISTTRRLVASSNLPIFVGITDTSLIESLALAKYSAEQGATAVVAAPPFYFPAGQTELRHWFTLLADQSPLPLILYNMPSCVKIDIAAENLSALLQHPNICGLKDSSGNLDYLSSAVQIAGARADWPVLVGPEALLIQATELGAVGGVTGGANLCPRLFTQLLQAIRTKDMPEIDRLQSIVQELQQLYQFGKYGSSYLKGLKCALDLSGYCSGLLAPPFDSFNQPERRKVEQWLAQFSRHGFLDT
jgi:dihydrodipicolinate synthase/N-acetylneuraminate lyase